MTSGTGPGVEFSTYRKSSQSFWNHQVTSSITVYFRDMTAPHVPEYKTRSFPLLTTREENDIKPPSSPASRPRVWYPR